MDNFVRFFWDARTCYFKFLFIVRLQKCFWTYPLSKSLPIRKVIYIQDGIGHKYTQNTITLFSSQKQQIKLFYHKLRDNFLYFVLYTLNYHFILMVWKRKNDIIWQSIIFHEKKLKQKNILYRFSFSSYMVRTGLQSYYNNSFWFLFVRLFG